MIRRALMKTLIAAGSLQLLAYSPALDASAGQDKGSQVRVIARSDSRIPTQVLPDDQEIMISEWAIVDTVRLTDDELIRLRVESAVSIVVARITSVGGELTKDETWINTRLHGLVEQVVKGDSVTPPGGAFAAYLHGGEARVGTVRVRAGEFPLIAAGARYLLFLGRSEEPKGIPIVEWVHQLTSDNHVKAVEAHRIRGASKSSGRSGTPRDPFHDKSLPDVLSVLQEYMQ